jgi:hypothetical protein
MQCHIPDDCNVDTHSLKNTNCNHISCYTSECAKIKVVAYSKMNTYECTLYTGEQDVPMHLSEIGYSQEQVMVNECTVLCQECRTGEGVRST